MALSNLTPNEEGKVAYLANQAEGRSYGCLQSLDQIPEMLVLILKPGDSLPKVKYDPHSGKTFGAKFVQLIYQGKNYLFSAEDPVDTHSVFTTHFGEICRTLGDSESFRHIRVIGGGLLEISPEQVRLSGQSKAYGKYKIETARPIVERYASEHSIDTIVLE